MSALSAKDFDELAWDCMSIACETTEPSVQHPPIEMARMWMGMAVDVEQTDTDTAPRRPASPPRSHALMTRGEITEIVGVAVIALSIAALVMLWYT
jgi:hypothetical protein